MVALLCEELVGWSSWFRAVTHARWMRPFVWTALPFRAEPMCEAERTHHPVPELEKLVRSDDLQFKSFIYKYSVFGIMTEHADGDNLLFEFKNSRY